MIDRMALRPNLSECLLEDRTLMVAPPGLFPNQFFTINPFTNQFIVPGTSTGGSGGATTVGPQYFYLVIGAAAINSSFGASNGPSGTFGSIYGLRFTAAGGSNVSIGSGANGGGGGSGGTAAPAFGGSFSSGYNTSLNATNNFGMTSVNSVGSVPVHTYDAGGASTTAASAASSSSTQTSGSTTPMSTGVDNPGNSLGDRLLGKGLGKSNSLITGPGTRNP